MKVNKLVEKQAGADYEAAGTEYLNQEFSDNDNIEFEQAGENNSLVSDILVKKDDQDKFYIECKDTTHGAQAGEFGVKLNDGKLSLISKTHDMKTAIEIIDAVNDNLDVDEITTGTIKLIDIPGVKEIAEKRIFDIYKYDKNTEYIMAPGNIKYNIASIEDWNKLLKLKEVNLRWKANNSSNISGIAQKEVIPFIKSNLKAKNIIFIKSGSGSKVLFDSVENIQNYYSFETPSGRTFLVTIVTDRDGAYEGTTQKYQLRTPGGRGIIIFALGMNNPNVNQLDDLKKDLGVNEGLNMRKNLSEELEINDDIKLNNGEEEKPEEEKDGKKVADEVQKELDAKNKIADEIRDAKAPKAELNDGMGKSLKVKQFVEKLTLKEPNDQLNEDYIDDIEDMINEYYFDATHAVYNELVKYCKKLEELGQVDYMEACQAICDEALIRLEDGEF